MKFVAAVFLVALGLVAAEQDASLIGSKVFSVFATSKKQFQVLEGLESHVEGIDFWQRAHVLGREARILVPKDSITVFQSLMNAASIPFEVLIDDVKGTLEEEVRVQNIARQYRVDGKISFTSYNRYAEINSYLDDLASRFPNTVKVQTLGKSGQGRDMKVIRISTTGGNDARKPIIIVDAGIHAREWIAPANALYMITKLVEDITESDIVNGIDWIIIPLLNPDGYEYSHTNTRLWRKTRSTVSSTTCPGVDGNRNFDYKWMVSGSSSSACSDIFAGPRAFSEPETQYLRDLILQNKARAKGYMAMHSYGSYFLYPYGYDGSLPSNGAQLQSLGLDVAKAIDSASAAGSQKYLVGNSAIALNYKASGASDDYALAEGGIALSYTLELPGGGSAGFDLPPSRINQVVKETWPGMVVFARAVIRQAIADGMYV